MTIPRRPPYDPELSAALAAMEPSLTEFAVADIAQIRIDTAGQGDVPIEQLTSGRDLVVEEHLVPSGDGAVQLPVSVFRPANTTVKGPCVYFTHGGGMIFGHRLSHAEMFPDWVETFGVTIVSVDYRLAPEHPHPTPSEDCYAGLLWTVEHAEELGIDPRRLLVAGVSAGGGLAASLALMSRDRGGPALLGQLLICPMLDDRDDTESTRQFESGPWNRSNNRVAWSALLGHDGAGPNTSAYAAPARAADLSGLPPTYLEVGSAEVFRDENVEYASRLWAAGVATELHVWAGGFHCFWQIEHAAVSQAATSARDDWLGRLLGLSAWQPSRPVAAPRASSAKASG